MNVADKIQKFNEGLKGNTSSNDAHFTRSSNKPPSPSSAVKKDSENVQNRMESRIQMQSPKYRLLEILKRGDELRMTKFLQSNQHSRKPH